MNTAQRKVLMAWINRRTPGVSEAEIRHALKRLTDADVRPLSADERSAPLAHMIDHTALGPQTMEADIHRLCTEAVHHSFASVCVPPCYVSLAASLLRETGVPVCTVVGFPHGNSDSSIKAAGAERAVEAGASEIDMVLNVGLLKSGRLEEVEDDIRTTVKAVSARGLVKVILECALLTEEEKVVACILAQQAGADFVKTSTGFAAGGATLEDVALMRRVVGKTMGVKAAGGIRTRAQAEKFVAHGATRIGASASVSIVAQKGK